MYVTIKKLEKKLQKTSYLVLSYETLRTDRIKFILALCFGQPSESSTQHPIDDEERETSQKARLVSARREVRRSGVEFREKRDK
jgi:hypothetical protein